MEVDIAQQGRSLLLCLSLGMGGGLFYDLLRAVRVRRKKKATLTHVLDGIFTGVAACILLYLCEIRGGGELRLYMIVNLLVGAAVWFTFPGPYCRELWNFWLEVAETALKLLWKPAKLAIEGIKKLSRFVKKGFSFSRKYVKIKRVLPVCVTVYHRRKRTNLYEDKKEKSAETP